MGQSGKDCKGIVCLDWGTDLDAMECMHAQFLIYCQDCEEGHQKK